VGTNVAVIFYSSTGTNHAMAKAVAEGAQKGGASEVRVLRVPENAPREAVEGNPDWKAWLEGPGAEVPEATLDDLVWADGIAFGTPTRFGNVASQMKSFLDSSGPLWAEGKLVDKVVTGFTSALNTHGGNESTLLALYNTMYHFGAIVVAPGYTDPAVYAGGGNPYGTSHALGQDQQAPSEEVLDAARHQGRRLAEVTARLKP
jgi:NAD(P)H dehydrogenase (quinone)